MLTTFVSPRPQLKVLHEGMKEGSSIVIVANAGGETMQIGSIAGFADPTMGIDQDRTAKESESQPMLSRFR